MGKRAILGISAFYHDSAAALLVDGQIVAAAQEERFTRRKHDASFPAMAIAYVLQEGGVSLTDLEAIVFYDKPFLKFERLLETYIAFAPRGLRSFSMAMPVWLREKLFLKDLLLGKLVDLEGVESEDDSAAEAKPSSSKALRRHLSNRILFSEHHMSHAASAFYPSPFEEAAVLTLDGVGEWATTTFAVGRGAKLTIEREIQFPHSLGLLYSAFTYYLGFKVNSGEYKVMGLAPYGEPRFKELILKHLIDLKSDGSYRLDMRYFNYATGLTMTNARFADLFGHPVRRPETDLLTPFHMDVAASIQAVTEEVVLRMCRSIASQTGQRNLCMAGGVALNCVANGKIVKEGIFDQVWIQPAAGDAGGALGAALAAWHQEFGMERRVGDGGEGAGGGGVIGGAGGADGRESADGGAGGGAGSPETASALDAMRGSYLGPSFSPEQIRGELEAAGAVFERLSEREMLARTAEGLAEGKAVGWFQGRMEFGPRALGARSILGDPRSETMQKTLNLKVKFRESFRPFAPAVLREDLEEWFDLETDSPYMLLVADVLERHRREMTPEELALFGIDKLNVKRSQIPAVTHVDYSARIQTVHKETNPLFYALLSEFKRVTGCPVLVNTSFNVRGEPIVGTPSDAFRCFMGTDLDLLVVGEFILEKTSQNPALVVDYKGRYELD